MRNDIVETKTFNPRVTELMSTDLFTLLEDDNIETLEELMKWRRIRHVPVVDLGGNLVGIVTHRDFLSVAISELARIRKGDAQKLYRKIPVREVMNRQTRTVTPDTSLSEAATILFENKLGCLPVVKGGRLVGIITEADFVRAFAQWDAQFRDV